MIERALINNLVNDIDKIKSTEKKINKDIRHEYINGLMESYGKLRFTATPIFADFESTFEPKLNTYKSAGIEFNGQIYIIGGLHEVGVSESASSEVYVYEHDGFEGYMVEQLPFGLYEHDIVNHNGKLYIIGGRKPDGSINADIIERLEGGVWQVVNGVEGFEGVVGACVVVDGGYVYVLGGMGVGGVVGSIKRSTDLISWEVVGNLPKELEGHHIVKVIDKFYLLGGRTVDGGYNTGVYITEDLTNYELLGNSGYYEFRDNYEVVAVGETLYWLGGYRDGRMTPSIYRSLDGFYWEYFAGFVNGGLANMTLVKYFDSFIVAGCERQYGIDGAIYITRDIVNENLNGEVMYSISKDFRYEGFGVDCIRVKSRTIGGAEILADLRIDGELIVSDISPDEISIRRGFEEFNTIDVIIKASRVDLDGDVVVYSIGVYYER